jgi:Leucine Rich repeat
VRRVHLHWERGPLLACSYVPRLADCAFLKRLNHLDLSDNILGSDGLQALLVATPLTGLTSLSLRECQIGDRGARALAQSPLLTQLTWLDLSHNEIGPGGVRVLAQTLEGRRLKGGPSPLRELLLQGNPLGDAGRRAVLASRVLSRAAHLPPPERTWRGIKKR